MSHNENLNEIQKQLKVLTFLLNDTLHAAPVSDIAEVNRMVHLKPIESAPDWVLGLINLHGETTAVLNLKKVLSIEPSGFGQEAMWLAVKNGKSSVCLAIDNVHRLIDLEPKIINTIPILAENHDMKYVKCYARLNNSSIPVLDVKAIIGNNKRS